MFYKVLSLMLIAVIINAAGITSVRAGSQEEDKQARLMEKVRENVRKLGVGEAARVEVRLQDGRKLKGYIREAGEDSFVVVEAKTGAATTVAYPEVKQIKGSNRLTAAKVGLTVVKGVAVVAAVAGAFTLLLYVLLSQSD